MADTQLAECIPTNTVNEILEQKSLRWVFVGGKGGVGKTTTSSALATLLAAHRKNVLIISTDPAHNLSDAFGQKFSNTPTLVNGFTNLSAMEVDTSKGLGAEEEEMMNGMGMPGMSDIMQSIPGIDEAMSFAQMMNLVQTMDFDLILFDTAPTGHTLRLLSLPETMRKAMGKAMEMKSRFGPLMSQAQAMFSAFGGGANVPAPTEQMQESFFGKLESMTKLVEKISSQFQDPDMTTFVCVCIPEFLSLYETERLLQELAKLKMDSRCIVVNQVLIPPPDSACQLCTTRKKMQRKHLEQISELYDDFSVVKVPLLDAEVRGVPALRNISQYLVRPITLS